MDNLLKKIVTMESLLTKLDLSPDSVVTIQSGIIVDAQDDLQLGRVKVQLDTRGNNATRWSYFLGYPSGQVPPEYVKIGTRVACAALYGNSNELLILGTFGSDSLPNPVSIPLFSSNDNVPLPLCNEKSIGHMHLLENKNGSDVNICVRSGDSYIWRKLFSSLITENQGLTPEQQKSFANLEVPSSLGDDAQPFSPLPICDQSKQGQIIPFSERDEWRQFNIICSKDENGDFIWKPASTIPIFSRNNIPNPSEKYHGTVIQIDDGANSYLAYCARENGTMKWMKYTGREPVKFTNSINNDRPNNKSRNSPQGAVENLPENSTNSTRKTNPAPAEVPVAAENALNVARSIVEGAIKGTGLAPTTKTLLEQASQAIGITITPEQLNTAISIGGTIAQVAGVDIPSGIPTQIGNILTSKDPLKQVITSAGAIVSSYGDPRLSTVLYGVASGGWQGGLDAAVTAGLSTLPRELQGSFGDYIKNIGGVDALPGPLKDIANSALGNINIGLKDVSKYILSGSLFKDLSNANFDLSKLDLSINPAEIGNFLKSVLPGNIDLTNLKLDAGTLSKSLSGVLSYAGLGGEFSSLFGSNGLGTNLANALFGEIAKTLTQKQCEPCSCDTRKCTVFRDPAKDNLSLYEDCKIVVCGQTTYSPCNNPSEANQNKIASGFNQNPTELGQEIQIPTNADLTQFIKATRLENKITFIESDIKCADEPDKVRERNYTNETISKGFKTADNNITKLELTDKQVIDGLQAIIRDIFGCGLDSGGIFGEINSLMGEFINTTKTLATITNTLNSITNAGLGSEISTIINQLGNYSSLLSSISDKLTSRACQIKADFIQPAQNTNNSLTPGFPTGSYTTPFKGEDLETQNNLDRISKEKLLESVFDGIPDPKIFSLPNRVSTLSSYLNKDKVDSILSSVFNDPEGTSQVFEQPTGPVDNQDLINKAIQGLTPNEENGRFAGEKDCR